MITEEEKLLVYIKWSEFVPWDFMDEYVESYLSHGLDQHMTFTEYMEEEMTRDPFGDLADPWDLDQEEGVGVHLVIGTPSLLTKKTEDKNKKLLTQALLGSQTAKPKTKSSVMKCLNG